MRLRALVLTVVAALMFAVPGTSRSQSGVTYVQSNHVCLITECSGAQFNPTATLSYTNSLKFYGNGTFIGTATWNGTEYTDFSGTFTYLGQHAGRANWELKGAFNEGHDVLTEDWNCFRSCGERDNVSGSVVQN
jgi:hypothetical protein